MSWSLGNTIIFPTVYWKIKKKGAIFHWGLGINFQALGSRDSNVLIASAVKSKFLLEQIETPRAKHQQPKIFLNKFVVSLLLIENRLLLQLQQKQSFYDAVTEKFIVQKRKIELCYK